MKRIKLAHPGDDAPEVEAALLAANGKAKAHTITDPEIVFARAMRFVDTLEQEGVLYRERAGALFVHVPAGPTAKRHKNAVPTTHLVFQMGADGKTVYLLGAEQTTVHPRQREINRVSLKESSHATWLARKAHTFGKVPAL